MVLTEIPLKSLPNQTFSTLVNNQQLTIDLYQRNEYLFCNIYLNATLIVDAMKCNNAVYLNQYPTLLKGYLFFYTNSKEEPTYLTLGTDAHLFYSDYDALAIDYQNWVIDNG
jgi:hypothetical protein